MSNTQVWTWAGAQHSHCEEVSMTSDAQKAILGVFVTHGTKRLPWERNQAYCWAKAVS